MGVVATAVRLRRTSKESRTTGLDVDRVRREACPLEEGRRPGEESRHHAGEPCAPVEPGDHPEISGEPSCGQLRREIACERRNVERPEKQDDRPETEREHR